MRNILYALVFFPMVCFAWTDAPSCLYEIQTRFFPHDIARQSFDLYYIFQSQWDPILTGLDEESKAVPSRMREKARLMHPNPLEHPYDPEKTKELLLAIEYEVFRTVLIRNYFYNLQAIQGMFDFIVSKQMGKIDACLGKKRAQRMQKNIK